MSTKIKSDSKVKKMSFTALATIGKGTERAQKAWKKRRINQAWLKAHAAEAASKAAFKRYFEKHGWRVGFFEGPTGSPRTGIIDAIAFRIAKGHADVLDLRLIQLKGGKAGISGAEIARLKKAVGEVEVSWLIAAYDGKSLHLLPDLES